MRCRIFLGLSICVIAMACRQNPQPASGPDEQELREALEGTNILLLEAENQEIDDFVERYKWDVVKTGSGLRYFIYEHGNGPTAQKGQTAVIEYSIRLLNGELVYSSEEQGTKSFLIGRGGVESGLEEGILLLKVGDRAKLIMPAHLAHGVPGDGAKIPRRAALVFDVKLLHLL